MADGRKFIIKEELATQLLNYLAGRPYVEVVQLINGLQIIEEFKPEPFDKTFLPGNVEGANV